MHRSFRPFSKLKKKDHQVFQSEEVYRTIYNQTFEIIFIHDRGIIIDINPAFERRTGYTREEIIGKNGIELFIIPEYKSIVLNAMHHEVTLPYEVVVQLKDGTLMDVEIESRRIIIEGREARITGIRDISLQKKTELALKESEERYKRLSDITLDAIFIHKQGIVIDANQSLADMLGYTLDELIGQNIIQIAVLPPYREKVIEAVKNESTTPYEIKVRRKNGTELFVEIEARMGDYHGEWLRVTIARDITLRKEAELKLLENEQELDSFFFQSQDGFFIMRMDEAVDWNANADKEDLMEKIGDSLRLVKINQAMKNQLGLEKIEVAGKSLKDVFPWNQFIKTLMTTLFNAGSVTFETSEFRHGKSTIWIEGNYLALLDANGFIRGCCGVRRDITERKLADEAIRIHNEELKKHQPGTGTFFLWRFTRPESADLIR
ncbi:MAG: PAS domain-containing protein [Cyclobacteriaceae bacterium]|nr:PAS domain-containing protein [Cyclobacteriaceae bacterium]